MCQKMWIPKKRKAKCARKFGFRRRGRHGYRILDPGEEEVNGLYFMGAWPTHTSGIIISWILIPLLSLYHGCVSSPKDGRECLMSPPPSLPPPGLESQGCHLIPIYFLLSCLFFLPSPIILSVFSFSACWPILLNFFQKILRYFSLREAYLYGSCLAGGRSKLVGGMCSVLP